MQTFRGVVLPVLRLGVWSVIALALVVLAFRGGSGAVDPGGDVAQPAALQLESPHVPVVRGSV